MDAEERSVFADIFKSYPLYALPHRLLSAAMHWFMRIEQKQIKNLQIRLFRRAFDVDMTQARERHLDDYHSFNEFFTRPLKADVRPLPTNPNEIACPADGSISQIGKIKNGQLLQAKGISYSLNTLIGGLDAVSKVFNGGHFATIYLSPRDYHRVHMPSDGQLYKMVHIPGRLFSVAPHTARTIPNLFARNERVVCLFKGERGPFAVILVGAIFVSSMETVWDGVITPPYGDSIEDNNYSHLPPIRLKRGDEMGRFNMGSTAILLYPPKTITWSSSLDADSQVKMGQSIGAFI